MITEVSAIEFQQNLGEMLSQVQHREGSVLINMEGKPIAALIDANLFANLQRMQAQFDEVRRQFSAAYANVPMEEGLAEIEKVCAVVRKEMA